MVNSINTNTSAAIGLQRLSSNRNSLETTQSHISSGKKINSPKDDAATLAIAQELLATFSGTEAVRDGLNRATATIDVALAAGQSSADLLVEMKGLAVQASQEGLDQTSRDALNSAFNALRDQIVSINDSAEFAGSNLIAAGAAVVNWFFASLFHTTAIESVPLIVSHAIGTAAYPVVAIFLSRMQTLTRPS